MMLVLERKTRILNIRLSEGEYEKLHDACVEGNARSLSDFVRDTLFAYLESTSPSGHGRSMAANIEKLKKDIQLLNAIVLELRKLMKHATPSMHASMK